MSAFYHSLVLDDCEVEWTLISEGYPETRLEPEEPPEFLITVRYNGHDITSILREEDLNEIQDLVIGEYNDLHDDYCEEDY